MTPIDAFAAGPAKLRAAVAGLTPEQLAARPIAGTWSIHEIVVHLMDSDSIGIDRMKRIAAEKLPLLIGYDQDLFIAGLFPHAQNIADALDVFELNRRLFVTTLRALPPEAFDKAGIHNEIGRVTLAEMLDKYVHHLDHHLTFVAKKRSLV